MALSEKRDQNDSIGKKGPKKLMGEKGTNVELRKQLALFRHLLFGSERQGFSMPVFLRGALCWRENAKIKKYWVPPFPLWSYKSVKFSVNLSVFLFGSFIESFTNILFIHATIADNMCVDGWWCLWNQSAHQVCETFWWVGWYLLCVQWSQVNLAYIVFFFFAHGCDVIVNTYAFLVHLMK